MRKQRALAAMAGLILLAAAPSTPVPDGSPAFQAEYRQAQAAMYGDPNVADAHAERARRLAAEEPDPERRRRAEAASDWLGAEAKIALNRPADATRAADAGLSEIGGPDSGTLTAALLLRSRGFAEAMVGQVEHALSDFHQAFALFGRQGDARRQALTLQDIGAIYGDAGDYAHMLRYYRQSSEVGLSDPIVELAAHYNIALALGKMNRTAEAQAEFTRALAAARAVHSSAYEARALTELSEARLRSHDLDGADRYAQAALALANGDPSAAGWRPLVLAVGARVAMARGRPEVAEAELQQAFRGIDLSRTDLSFHDLHEVAVSVFRARGDYVQAFANLEALKRLDSQAQTLASNTNAALMSARFDFQNQDLKIARLQASHLQQAIQLEHASTRLHRMVFAVAAVLGGTLLVVMGLALVGTRRSRNEIRSVNGELLTANEALERALQVKTEFLATTSHEIRTPLNGILGMTQVLLADRKLAGGVRDRIEVVHSAGQTMRALVDDILDVAKLESGRVELDPAPASLHELFGEAARLWGAEAGRKGLIFQVDAEGAPDRIVTDAQRLRQILFNLLSNAIKFTDNGRIVMTADVVNGPQVDMLAIAVEDTGIGIAPEWHEPIFESFRQADGGTTRRFGGTGLGLAICRRLASAMGGTVTVESEVGRGARFTLQVPLVLAVDDPAQPARSCPEPVASLSCSRLLLVDRNPLNRGILNALLSRACREVLSASDLDEATSHVASGQVDLVVADAGSLASEPATVIDAIAALRPLPIVLLVGRDELGQTLAAAETGARLVVAKPVAGPELIGRLVSLFVAPEANGADVDHSAYARRSAAS